MILESPNLHHGPDSAGDAGPASLAGGDGRVLRLLSGLCVAYWVLLVYASLMPFDLNSSLAEVQARLHRARNEFPSILFAHGGRGDIVANVLLYIPLALMMASRLRAGPRGRWLAATAAVGLASLTSLMVETGQLLSAVRNTSIRDWISNTAGGLLGGIAGAALGAAWFLRLARAVRRGLIGRPAAVVAAMLALLLAADALFPYVPTIDVSQVKRSLRRSDLTLGGGLSRHPWHYWAVEVGGVYAVLAALTGSAMARRNFLKRWAKAALASAVLAAGLESLKPFITGRTLNVANVAVGAGGAAAGAVLAFLLAGRLDRRRWAAVAAGLLGVYIAYLELEPFRFVFALDLAGRKVPHGAEWLPLYYYAMGARIEDVFLFARSIVLAAAMVCAIGLARGRPAEGSKLLSHVLAGAAIGGAMGLALECCQFFLPGRTPSTTDVFSFALGGAVGGWVLGRSGRVCKPRYSGICTPTRLVNRCANRGRFAHPTPEHYCAGSGHIGRWAGNPAAFRPAPSGRRRSGTVRAARRACRACDGG